MSFKELLEAWKMLACPMPLFSVVTSPAAALLPAPAHAEPGQSGNPPRPDCAYIPIIIEAGDARNDCGNTQGCAIR